MASALLLAGSLLPTARVQAQPLPFLVHDLNPSAQIDIPPNLPWFAPVVLDGVAYYAGYDGIHGYELWRTDGTAAGTWLVKDICPGVCASSPEWLASAGTQVFFAANDGEHGTELWVSDGTAAGTRLVADLWPGRTGSLPRGMDELGDMVVFSADTPGIGREPWASDGTAGGTVSLGDVVPGPNGSSSFFASSLGAVGTRMLLCLLTSSGDANLWSTDGSPSGTLRLLDQNPDAPTSCIFRTGVTEEWDSVHGADGRLYFCAGDDAHGGELWASDGTASGTVLVSDALPGPEGLCPVWLRRAGDRLFFLSSNDFATGPELWSSDGTAAGTTLVTEFTPGPDGFRFVRAAAVGSKYFFLYLTGPGRRLGVSDGTLAGTFDVATFPSHPGFNLDRHYAWMRNVEGRLFFSGFDPATGVEPWVSDGTPEGTSLLADVNPGPDSSFRATGFFWLTGPSFERDRLVEVEQGVLFRAFDRPQSPEVWVSDGTVAGTHRVADADHQASAVGPLPSFSPGEDLRSYLTAAGDQLFFAADEGTGRALYRSRGTPSSSARLTTLTLYAAVPWLRQILPFGSSIVFFDSAGGESYLGISDGTLKGTRPLADPGVLTVAPFVRPATFAGEIFFAGTSQSPLTGDLLSGLLRSDGTTIEVADDRGVLDQLLLTGDQYLSYVGGPGLVRRSATGQVTDVAPEPGSMFGQPVLLAEIDSVLFFQAFDADHGAELWIHDPTQASAQRLPEIAPGTASALRLDGYGRRPRAFAAAGGQLYFVADDGTTGQELWRADTSGEAPRQVADLLPGAAGSEPEHLTAVGDWLFFVADDGVHGRELWTVQGGGVPVLLADLVPGPGSSQPTELASADGKLYWSAWTAASGREPWVSDGTPAGTRLAGEIAPGPLSSSPMQFTQAGGRIYFAANDNTTGFELWAFPVPTLFADGFETGDLSAWSAVVPSLTPSSARSAPPLR